MPALPPSFTRPSFTRKDLQRIKRARRIHELALRQVLTVLRLEKVPFHLVKRVSRRKQKPYDLVVSVGGDGTFLEAARAVRRQPILGVNSNPGRSAGSFCKATAATFERFLNRVLQGDPKIVRLNRLQIIQNGRRQGPLILNELLVTHRRPAAMSRYWLQVGHRSEDQRSSGLWVSTAAGSTGAIRSAGGQTMKRDSRQIQYRPRELYAPTQKRYHLRGGLLRQGTPFRVGSLMRHGLVCVDGEHIALPFHYGDLLEVRNSSDPLHWVVG